MNSFSGKIVQLTFWALLSSGTALAEPLLAAFGKHQFGDPSVPLSEMYSHKEEEPLSAPEGGFLLPTEEEIVEIIESLTPTEVYELAVSSRAQSLINTRNLSEIKATLEQVQKEITVADGVRNFGGPAVLIAGSVLATKLKNKWGALAVASGGWIGGLGTSAIAHRIKSELDKDEASVGFLLEQIEIMEEAQAIEANTLMEILESKANKEIVERAKKEAEKEANARLQFMDEVAKKLDTIRGK